MINILWRYLLANKRGKSPSKITLMKLWAISGGRCQFAGCNRRLYKDDLTWDEFNNSNIAHIVAASPDGPRGSELSHELSDKLENLMLLCPSCHKRIDSNPIKYTVDFLRKMKCEQERKGQDLLDSMDYPESEIVILESPIKGKIVTHVDPKLAMEALRSARQKPASKNPIVIDLKVSGSYSSKKYWNTLVDELQDSIQRYIERIFKRFPDTLFSVFPMAPIPLIAKLGENLGDKQGISIFQKTRVPNTWCWVSKGNTNSFNVRKTISNECNTDKVAIVLSLTSNIVTQRIKAINNYMVIYEIVASRKDVNCISSEVDLKNFWLTFQKVCDSIKNDYRLDEADIFPAIPVSAAFEIGHRYMSHVYPKLHIYDEYNGFFEALTIGDE